MKPAVMRWSVQQPISSTFKYPRRQFRILIVCTGVIGRIFIFASRPRQPRPSALRIYAGIAWAVIPLRQLPPLEFRTVGFRAAGLVAR